MNKLEEFLKELSELTIKYGFIIGGCGCCGSPYIFDEKGNDVLEDLYFDKNEQKYK